MKVVLASRSPRRLQLLRAAGIDVEVIAPSYEERPLDMPPAALAEHHALQKARSVRGDVVVGADTLVVFEGRVYGKPRDRDEAFAWLRAFQRGPQDVITGVAVIGRAERVFHETSRVWLRRMSDDDIRAYHARVDPLDKAGACETSIVERCEGPLDNVEGLPVARVLEELRRV